MSFDWFLAWNYVGTMWFVQLCMLLDYAFLVGKKSDYLLCMTIRGEQREDVGVKRLVSEFKKQFWQMHTVMFAAAGGVFLIVLLPAGIVSLPIFYVTFWITAVIWWEFKVVSKYTNHMYDLKIEKGWGNPPKESAATVDTVVSRMKRSMPVSEIWLAIPAWICIGSFAWWFYYATEYKILLVSLIFNVGAFVLFCYMYYRMSHGKLKVYSEDSEINYALNRTAKKAWTGCVVWEASLLCGYHFVITLLLHSYMKRVAEGTQMTGFWTGFIAGTAIFMVLIFAVFFVAANKVKQAKKELAAAADFSYAEDEDAYWRKGYYYNPQDTNTFVENRGYGITTNMATKWGAITKWMLIGAFVLCVGIGIATLPLDFGKLTMQVGTESLELKGCLYYSKTLDFDEVTEVHLITEWPESSRVWGTGTDRFAMGDYHFKDYGNGKAMMDREAEYFILAKKEDGKWFGFGVTDSEAMLLAYERLKGTE